MRALGELLSLTTPGAGAEQGIPADLPRAILAEQPKRGQVDMLRKAEPIVRVELVPVHRRATRRAADNTASTKPQCGGASVSHPHTRSIPSPSAFRRVQSP